MQSVSYTTLASVKSHLGIDSTFTGEDIFLTNLILQASSFIEIETGNQIKRRPYQTASATDSITGLSNEPAVLFDYGTRVLVFPTRPISTLEDITVEISYDKEDWETLIENTDYYVDYHNGVITMNIGGKYFSRVSCHAGEVFGDEEPYVAPALQYLCNELVEQMYRNTDQRSSEAIGDKKVSYNLTIPSIHQKVIDRYSNSTMLI